MSNHLKNETSPYLLQHANNPVNWYSWCDEAFDRARSENKPVFLSIGYSTCHWCHVMAHESFEDAEIADILNKYFISVKVDREERPDIDSVYMAVCQAFTGSGGWPMSIFMTWDKKPFFAGTYFPPRSRHGMPSFSKLINTIAKQWEVNRAELLRSADKAVEILKGAEFADKAANGADLPEKAVDIFSHTFDSINGGFGTAPKFPTPHNLLFLMLYAKQNENEKIFKMAEKTLLQMRKGGIFDHIGGGFSRYSTDEYFLVPHFEKMLYDNVLLIIAYLAAYSISRNAVFLDTVEKTAEFILNEMTSPDGGFYSAQDADSDGVEGKYYTFSLDEIMSVLGKERGAVFAKAFDITSKGNFEGTNIPNLLKSGDFGENFSREIKSLCDYRKKRFSLHLDDKIILSWNSMAIAAFSILYRVTKNEKYLNAAKNANYFIEKNLCEKDNLYTSFCGGKHSDNAVLDDYAFYIASLIELYNSSLDKNYLKKAEKLVIEAVRLFYDNKNGGFYFCKADNSEFFINPKEAYDGAVPSGNSVMAYNFVRLYQLTEKYEYLKHAENQLAFMSARAQDYPAGYCMFLTAMLIWENPPIHITAAVKDFSVSDNLKNNLPFLANISVSENNGDYPLLNDKTTYYVCKNNVCLPPSNNMELTDL